MMIKLGYPSIQNIKGSKFVFSRKENETRFSNRTVFIFFILFLFASRPLTAQNISITKSTQNSVVKIGDTVTFCLNVDFSSTPKADIAWIVDVTASMSGEISGIESNINFFTSQLVTSGIDYQNGLVAFRDVNLCGDTPIQTFDFTSSNAAFMSYVNSLSALGGGDIPESDLEGLQAAVTSTSYCGVPTTPLSWRPDSTHVMILITDAPVHSIEYDGDSALSMFNLPVSLYNAGYVIDVISNDCAAGNCSVPACTICNPVLIASEAGGLWLPLSSASTSWQTFMTTLGHNVSVLTNVVIQDPLPPGLSPIAGGSSGESIVGNTISYTLPLIPLGSTPTPIVDCFTALVTSDAYGTVINTGSVSSDGISAISSNTVSILNIGLSPTFTPTNSCTPTITPTASFTGTPTPTATNTNTPTSTPTFTSTPTPTNTPTPTSTFTPTPTHTNTPTPTSTSTPTPTNTPLCDVRVWPDPYNPKFAVGEYLKVGCMPKGAKVSFYTLSGEWVNDGGEVSHDVSLWDGRNQYGAYVSPGIYFFVAQKNGQVIKRGKFLVVTGP